MKVNCLSSWRGRATRTFAGLGAAGVMVMASIPLSDGAANPDRCEQEAARAYWQALKICQLAESDNPRLRCYEAAKAVYIQTLQACQANSNGE